MKSVCVCNACGRTIEKNFIYCPWCGISCASSTNTEKILDPVFDRLEEIQNKNRLLRIAQIGTSIEELEKSLDYMVLQSELAR